MEKNLIEEGVEAVFRKLGPSKAIKFFQRMGFSKGNSLKEIESITESMTKDEVIEMLRKTKK